MSKWKLAPQSSSSSSPVGKISRGLFEIGREESLVFDLYKEVQTVVLIIYKRDVEEKPSNQGYTR